MNNDIFDNKMSKIGRKLQHENPGAPMPDPFDLDALFAENREHQLSLVDDNFTKIVINRLPASPKRSTSRPLLFDAVGLIIGLMAAYVFFDAGHFAENALSVIPESLSFTVANLAVLSGVALISAIGVSLLGWWTVEKAQT